MNAGNALFFLLVASASADCNFSYQTQCDGFEDISLHKTSNTWTNLIIQCDKCGNPDGKLESDAFKLTPNLEELHVVGKLRELSAGVFEKLENLNIIVLFKNRFNIIKSNWFANLKHILKLDLKENAIASVESGAFEDSTITQIILSGNSLSSINTKVLRLPGLKKLLLNRNNLVEISEGAFHHDLEYLDLSENRLSVFGLNVFNPLRNLNVLLLKGNRIKSVVAFPGAIGLEKLDLSHNSIEVIEEGAFVHFPRLRELRLQHNNLVFLNPKSFPPKSPLETLYLARNMLVFIPGEMGGVLHKLKFMTLGGNPWACACLTPVQNFIRQQGVVLEECDRRFFVDGLSPICLTTDSDRCLGTEWEGIVKTHLQNINTVAEQYRCSD